MNSPEPEQIGEPTPPIEVPDHKLLRCIGHGSYGEVWLGQNITGAYRAIKIIWRKNFRDQRPFERELAGITRFDPISRSHEGFVDVLHIGRDEKAGYFYYIMELADDCATGQTIHPEAYQPKTLSRVLAVGARLPLEECLQLGLSLSNALSHLHKRGLAHRDIKPSNIIFVSGLPKLADIGLVASVNDPRSYVGTEGFFPPEGPGTAQADIFSLGKVLYEISMGQDRKAFPRLPVEMEDWPEHERFLELNEVLVRACADDVRQRYQTAEEMHADLTFLLDGKSVSRLRQLERRFAYLLRAGIAAGIVLVLLGFAFFEWERERRLRNDYRSRQIGGQMANGTRTMAEGNLLEALPSFVEAMRLDDKNKEATHRLRLGLVLQQCPKLLQMWSYPADLADGQFSRDGNLAVIATGTNKAQVLDLRTGEALCEPFGYHNLESACFSPDGDWVLLGATHATASIWDWRTGERVLNIPHPKIVLEARFNPQGDRILTACEDKSARVWDLKGHLLFALTNHTEVVRSANYSSDGKWIITTSQDNSAMIWNASDGTPASPPLLHKKRIYQGSLSPDGRRLVTACLDNSAHVWDVASGREALPPLMHLDGVISAEFSPDGRLILTGSWDGTARLWDAATGRPATLNPILPHSARVLRASFHPDGHRVMTVCWDGTARIWDLAAGSVSAPRTHASFSLDGRRSLIQSTNWIQVADSLSKQTLARISLPLPLKEAALSDDGQFVLARCGSPAAEKQGVEELLVFDAVSGTNFQRVSNFTNSLATTLLSRTGHWLASYSANFNTNLVWLRDLSSSKAEPSCLTHTGTVRNICFSPTESELLTMSRNETKVWDLKAGNVRFSLGHSATVASAQFSHDGKLLATCCADLFFTECAAYVWDYPSGKPVGHPLQHRDGVMHADFAADNKRLVTSGEDFVAFIWEIGSSKLPRKLAHQDQVHDCCFDASGTQVLTVSKDQTARLWDAESGEPLGPPFPHPAPLKHGVFLGSDHFITFSKEGEAWLWKTKAERAPLKDLSLLVQVLNGKLETRSTGLGSNALYTAWADLRARYPEYFATTREELLAWHQQQGEKAMEEGQWNAAVSHFDDFLALQQDPSIVQLRLKASQELNRSRNNPRP